MDELTRSYYAVLFENHFMKLKGDAFQGFFSDIMEKRYPEDFVRVRATGSIGDQKNDGLLRSQRTLFQCYAPNELKAKACIDKIDEDFRGALAHWRGDFAKWVFVHNSRSGLGPTVTKKLLELSKSHKRIQVTQWGLEELRREIDGLDEAALVSLFGRAPSRQTMMKLGLSDLEPVLDHIARLPPVDDVDLRPVPADKLEYNLLSVDVATMLRHGMYRAPLVRKYFTRRPRQQDELAEAFRRQYRQLNADGANPDEIFSELLMFAAGARVSLPVRQAAALACLAFFFEECDIFERPESEMEAP